MKHHQTIEVFSPDEVPEYNHRILLLFEDGAVETANIEAPSRFNKETQWLSLVRRTELRRQSKILCWNYVSAIKPPPKPEAVTVRMRPGTERPAKGQRVGIIYVDGTTVDGTYNDWPNSQIAFWYPMADVVARKPWIYSESIRAVSDGSLLVRATEDGTCPMHWKTATPHNLPEGTRVRVTVSMEEVGDGE